jgi:hypothetical protein
VINVKAIKIELTHQGLQGMGCGDLANVIGLLNYACNVRGDKTACRQLDYVRGIAQSKGCTI